MSARNFLCFLCILFNLDLTASPQRQSLFKTNHYEHIRYVTESNDWRYPLGAFVGTLYGFGLGHVIQRRWLKDGWIFTVIPVASIYGAAQYGNREKTQIGISIAAIFGSKILEIIDLWSYNKQLSNRSKNSNIDIQLSIIPLPESKLSSLIGLKFNL